VCGFGKNAPSTVVLLESTLRIGGTDRVKDGVVARIRSGLGFGLVKVGIRVCLVRLSAVWVRDRHGQG